MAWKIAGLLWLFMSILINVYLINKMLKKENKNKDYVGLILVFSSMGVLGAYCLNSLA